MGVAQRLASRPRLPAAANVRSSRRRIPAPYQGSYQSVNTCMYCQAGDCERDASNNVIAFSNPPCGLEAYCGGGQATYTGSYAATFVVTLVEPPEFPYVPPVYSCSGNTCSCHSTFTEKGTLSMALQVQSTGAVSGTMTRTSTDTGGTYPCIWADGSITSTETYSVTGTTGSIVVNYVQPLAPGCTGLPYAATFSGFLTSGGISGTFSSSSSETCTTAPDFLGWSGLGSGFPPVTGRAGEGRTQSAHGSAACAGTVRPLPVPSLCQVRGSQVCRHR